MLYLIKGDIGSGKTEYLCEKIKERIEKNEKCYLIVPEQMTMSYERMMAQKLPPRSSFLFEVTNFSRLANTVFREFGGLSYSYASRETKALLMWRALGESLPEMHDRSAVEIGQVRKYIAAASEMSMCSIMPEELSAAASGIEDETLKNKIEDLSLVLSAYKKLTREKYADPSEDLDKLAKVLKENKNFFENSSVFIDDFSSFTKQEYAVIGEILKQCDVTVTLPLPPKSDEKICFEEVRECEKELVIISREKGHQKEERGFATRTPSPTLSYVARHLFAPASETLGAYDGERDGALSVIEAENPFDAADFVASDISKKVQNGERYSDFAIIARDSSRYEGILDRALAKYGIPYFMSTKTDLSSYAAIKLIYSAYAVCARNFDRRDVMTYVKCGLLDIDNISLDEFELYTEQWNITGKAFTDKKDWNMSRGGYTTHEISDVEFLSRVNETKNKIISPLLELKNACSGTHTVIEHCSALYNFICELGLEDKLYEIGNLQEESADKDVMLRLYSVICDALDKLADTLPNVKVNTDNFVQLLKIIFSETDIGRLPAYCDAVIVGNADMLRAKANHTYLFGVNAGEFPATVSDSSFFTQSDKEILGDADLELEKDLSVKASRELFCFYRAFCSATKTSTIIYTLSDTSHSASAPSSVVTDIRRLLREEYTEEDKLKKIKPEDKYYKVQKCAEIEKREFLWNKDSALSAVGSLSDTKKRKELSELLKGYDGYAKKMLSAERPINNTKDLISEFLASEMYDEILLTSASEFESYVKCGFSHFCNYFLSLDERKRAKIEPNDVGNFVHDVLENLFKNLAKNKKHISELDDGEVENTVHTLSDEYIKKIFPDGKDASPRMVHLFKRLTNAAVMIAKNLRDEFSQSKFSPRFMEFKISNENGEIGGKEAIRCSSIEVDTDNGKKVQFKGKIDRIDVYKDDKNNVYVRVVDYKTGTKKFSLDNVEKGLDLQMLIYLFSVCNTKEDKFKNELGSCADNELIPAGILYMPATVNNVSVDAHNSDKVERGVSGEFKRNGLILDDVDIIRAMEADGNGKVVPAIVKEEEVNVIDPATGKPKKDGRKNVKETKISTKGSIATIEKMEEIFAKTKKVIAKHCDEMTSGNANAVPLETEKGKYPCEYCKMKSICRKY